MAQAQDYPVAYVRCPRTEATVEISGEVVIDGEPQVRTRTMQGVDIYDRLPDVSHFFGGFSGPCDLVYRESSGAERILYDCTGPSTADNACAAMDPAVSFDGRTIAFTVFRGRLEGSRAHYRAPILDPNAENNDRWGIDLPVQILRTAGAQLHLVDVATGEVTELEYTEGIFDTGPAWLSNGRLAFTSNRTNKGSTLVFRSSNIDRVSQIFTMDVDGRNLELAGRHGLAGQQHPLQLRDGRVAYASWQMFGMLPFRKTNGSPGGFGTLRNLFHIYAQNPDGSKNFALYGQHIGGGSSEFGLPNHKAAHFLGQSTDGRIWTTDYYRSNNNGLGVVLGFMPEPDGLEGRHPADADRNDMYRPRDMINMASWASSSDQFARVMPEPEYRHGEYADPLPFAGKLGHPTGVPDNQLLVTWGKGACSTVAGNRIFGDDPPPFTSGSSGGTVLNAITLLGLDTPGCDAGVYQTSQIPSEHPSDLQLIVDEREWHELMARPVIPYADVHGVDRPADVAPARERASGDPWLDPGTPFGVLGASSILLRETAPRDGIPFAGEKQWGLQGTDTIDYTDDELCGIRILGVLPNRLGENRELFTAAGERVVVLGELPVRNFDGDGEPVMDGLGMHDTSFRTRFPANVPYLMQGIDCDGRTLNSDQTWQHLRPGERKTCNGCHVHSEPGLEFETTFAAREDYSVTRLGEDLVPLLEGGSGQDVRTRNVEGYGMQVELMRDVMPIFERRCNDCHGGTDAAAGLRLDVPGTEEGSTWDCLVRDSGQRCVPENLRHSSTRGTSLRRPQLSKYVRFMNARGSLLYWKAKGERTDGRLDSTYGPDDGAYYDVDFGSAHPTDITTEELGTLARWIDTGAGAGEAFLMDTLPPTLHVGPIADGEALTGLRIGSVDIPSGVDVGSLRVCVVDGAGGCSAELTPEARPHGVTAVDLPSALSDPDAKVRVTLRDEAGNETVVERTVAYLLGQPAPRPPEYELPDGGGPSNGGSVDGGVGAGRADGGPGTGPGATVREIEGSCGCTVPGRPGRAPFAGLALAALLWARLQRRRRRTRSR